MKTAGIVGGIGPKSTIEYYRLIIASYREQRRDGSYPAIVVDSIDLKTVLDLIEASRLADLTQYLLEEIRRLSRAGADFGALAANTPHMVFDALCRQSPIPLISIVEVTCQAAQARGMGAWVCWAPGSPCKGGFVPTCSSGRGSPCWYPDARRRLTSTTYT